MRDGVDDREFSAACAEDSGGACGRRPAPGPGRRTARGRPRLPRAPPRLQSRPNAATGSIRSGPAGAHLHDDRHRDPRPPRDRHDPDALDRRRPAGELRPPGCPDGRRADGLHALDPLPPPRPDAPGLARPRPLRPERRSRLDAPVLAPPPDRLRRVARRSEGVSPVGLEDARPPGVRADARRRGDHRPARPGLRERGRDGDRRGSPRGRVQPRRPRRRRPLDLHALLGRRPPGGHRVRGGVARRSPSPAQARRPL